MYVLGISGNPLRCETDDFGYQFERCGVNSQISVVAYDPVQSLLAIGTSDSQFGSGQIYVFGQRRVLVVFQFPRKASANYLQFCADKLISVDSKNEISIYSLETRRLVTSYAPPGQATALATDPSLDYAFIGLSNGLSTTEEIQSRKTFCLLNHRRCDCIRLGPRILDTI